MRTYLGTAGRWQPASMKIVALLGCWMARMSVSAPVRVAGEARRHLAGAQLVRTTPGWCRALRAVLPRIELAQGDRRSLMGDVDGALCRDALGRADHLAALLLPLSPRCRTRLDCTGT